MNNLSFIIKNIIDEKGVEIIKKPQVFCAILDDMASEFKLERNVFRKVLVSNPEICNDIYSIIIDKQYDNSKINMFVYSLQNNYGLNDSWIRIICDAFFSICIPAETNNRVITNNIESPVRGQFSLNKNKKNIVVTNKSKYVYLFSEGNYSMCNELGEKGANLAEATNLGLPVPPGFTIVTEACTKYYENGLRLDEDIKHQILEYIEKLEEFTGKKLGDETYPLLVSVRSGSRTTIPGMMDAILNVGMNEKVVTALAENSGNARWAYDCYRKYIQTFSDSVMAIPKKYFERYTDKMKARKGISQDTDLDASDLKELVKQFLSEYRSQIGEDFPSDPKVQLIECVKAVFRSWDNPRANVFRLDNNIPHSWGTAVTVQVMAFGNLGDDSGAGIVFTRDPATGVKKLMGEYLPNSQGNEYITGMCLPMTIQDLKQKQPFAYEQLSRACVSLENHFRDMQDVEFTIEQGRLYILLGRKGRRTNKAKVKIACDLVDEGLILEKEAVQMINKDTISALLKPVFINESLSSSTPLSRGLALSSGSASGKIVFSGIDAEEAAKYGINTIIVKNELFPEDMDGAKKSMGVLISGGGMTSRTAVMCRSMEKTCVSCSDIIINEDERWVKIGDVYYGENDSISIDGSTGCVFSPALPINMHPQPSGDLARILSWAQKYNIDIV